MNSSEPASAPAAPTDARSASPLVYASLVGSVFACSWLLFAVEPMSAKFFLPRLGGTPTVWITCLLFFQAALLAGYAYAHLSIKLLGLRRQALLHVGLVVVSLTFLPPSFDGSTPPDYSDPGLWLLEMLTATIGLPFFVLSSFGPIAQRWLAHADASRGDPYFLYAASNLGSLLALLAYPLIIEPLLPYAEQSLLWSVAYGGVVASSVLLATMVWRKGMTTVPATTDAIGKSAMTNADRFRWLVYAAVPSSLLMGVTSFISTDIASFPLLWVVPLALYLLSYALAFSRRVWLAHSLMVKAEAHAIVVVALTMYWAISLPGLFSAALHVTMLFLVAMVCHGELARTRPEPGHLTEFYFWLAAGGLIGGVFNALVAPIAFSQLLEYPIAIVAAAFLRPRTGSRNGKLDVLAPLLFGGALIAATWRTGSPPELIATLAMISFGVLLFSFRERPLRFALALALVFAIGTKRLTSAASAPQLVASERSFFGVYRVIDNSATKIRTIEHGTTVHGAQSLRPEMRLEPLSYYHRLGPAGDVFALTTPGRLPNRRVGLVGLGAGSLACYGRSNEYWTYYEIDPLVGQLASDTSYFTLLRDCPPRLRVVYGDARLTLRDRPANAYDLLVVDAFSSDAIPVHLMTREAFEDYFRVLDQAGVLAIHISNAHMDLQPLVAAIASDLGLVARVRYDLKVSGATIANAHSSSIWITVARHPDALGSIASDGRWLTASNTTGMEPWTDVFSNILSVVRWR